MILLKNQVCSLELAKKLKELGVEQESLFYYAGRNRNNFAGQVTNFQVVPLHDDAFDYALVIRIDKEHYFVCGTKQFIKIAQIHILVSAFTVAELGEMLPLTQCNIDYAHKQKAEWGRKCWGIECHNSKADTHKLIEAETEADARAKMLIYLIENGLVSIDK